MNVSLQTSIGFIVLAIWLIVTNVLKALSIGNQVIFIIMAVVGIIAGVLILLAR